VASDLGGIAEIVVEGQSGRLFPAGDAKALAALLDGFAADPARLATLRAPKPPSIDDNVASLRVLYEELITARTTPR
jgi:glycosyltransferase involved in cell wall biosynthesis